MRAGASDHIECVLLIENVFSYYTGVYLQTFIRVGTKAHRQKRKIQIKNKKQGSICKLASAWEQQRNAENERAALLHREVCVCVCVCV
jgi:hypothetical protein